jgi:hypothetical protein
MMTTLHCQMMKGTCESTQTGGRLGKTHIFRVGTSMPLAREDPPSFAPTLTGGTRSFHSSRLRRLSE